MLLNYIFKPSTHLIKRQNNNFFLPYPFTGLNLHFLDFILPLHTKLNIEYQSQNPKIHTIYLKMELTYKILLGCYIKRQYL